MERISVGLSKDSWEEKIMWFECSYNGRQIGVRLSGDMLMQAGRRIFIETMRIETMYYGQLN